MEFHQAYRVAYEAALAAQIISLKARLNEAMSLSDHNPQLIIERRLLAAQVSGLHKEIKHLNQGD